jgi:hypothetical protein
MFRERFMSAVITPEQAGQWIQAASLAFTGSLISR